jgi:hypothetical protein
MNSNLHRDQRHSFVNKSDVVLIIREAYNQAP